MKLRHQILGYLGGVGLLWIAFWVGTLSLGTMCGMTGGGSGIWVCGPVAGSFAFLFFFGGWAAFQATWERAREDKLWQQEQAQREKEKKEYIKMGVVSKMFL